MEDKSSFRVTPPILTYVGQACYHCFKARDAFENPLKRCNGCLRVYYCGRQCEKADWNNHKEICRAFQVVEKQKGQELVAPFLLLDNRKRDVEAIDMANFAFSGILIESLTAELKRPLMQSETNLIVGGPKCLCCGRTDAVFRLEATLSRQPSKAKYTTGLKPCPDCHLVFFCSRKHRKLTKDIHLQDDHSMSTNRNFKHKSQCAVNQLCGEDNAFLEHKVTCGADDCDAARIVTVYEPLGEERTWESEYVDFLQKKFVISKYDKDKMTHNILRAVSESLSMPMTILWALEQIHKDNFAWTKKKTLNIHILGYRLEKVFDTIAFEEILHKVPSAKMLKLTFCNVVHNGVFDLESRPMRFPTELCPDCLGKGRELVQETHPKLYHDYIAEREPYGAYTKPDLVIAFHGEINSPGLSKAWMETLKVLVKRRVPSVFTSYNQSEAEIQLDVLRRAGANVPSNLACKPNPWSSLNMHPEPNRLCGFYSTNGWICGFT